MKILRHSYDFAKRMFQRVPVPNFTTGLVMLLLTVTLVHQSTRLHQLEKSTSKAHILVSRRSSARKARNVVVTKSTNIPGAIYTRWGRTSCPANKSKLIYAGVVGGQHYSHTGGGSNILCLPSDPEWGNFTDKDDGSQYIYGGEYEITHYNSIHKTGLFSNANSETLHDHNVPCAVCQTIKPATIMMLPARKTCYPGWTVEYFGYLMSDHFRHKGRTPFTCVDVAPEADPAGYRNENGALFYNVQGYCGSLPCPPYVQNRELTCAVCSQSFGTHVHTFSYVNATKQSPDLQ